MADIAELKARLAGKQIDKAQERDKILRVIKEDYGNQRLSRVFEVRQKNILIIGRSRTGKSTIKSMLVDPTVIPTDMTLVSDTKDPVFKSYFIDDKEKLVLNIIDTPGVFEHNNTDGLVRSNDTIMDAIDACVNLEITKFHLVCFAFSMTAGIQKDDIEALKLFIERLGPGVSKNSCLIVTRCESKDDEQREKMRKELLGDQQFQPIASYFQIGIFFTGSINHDDYQSGQSSIIEQYRMVLQYRNELLNAFSNLPAPFQISQSYIAEIRRIRDEYKKKSEDLEKQMNIMSAQERTRLEADLKRKAIDEQKKAEKAAHDKGHCSIC